MLRQQTKEADQFEENAEVGIAANRQRYEDRQALLAVWQQEQRVTNRYDPHAHEWIVAKLEAAGITVTGEGRIGWARQLEGVDFEVKTPPRSHRIFAVAR